MLEHVRDILLKFPIYEITTCAIGYLRRKLLFWKNNDLTLKLKIPW